MVHGDEERNSLGNIKETVRLWMDRAMEVTRPFLEATGERLMLD